MPMTPIEDQRESFHAILCGIEEIKEVYFQPPHNVKLKYPCIIYSLNRIETKHANGKRYLSFPVYSITVIDYDPDSIIQKRILDLDDSCFVSFDRFFTSDNLNHWVYTIEYRKMLW